MSQSRQLAAIMFTDIVGYTSLMGKDSAKALELVRISKEIQKPLVEKNHGQWLKEMGDGALAKFNTALDAVNCSIEIQEIARGKLDAKLRIGLHLGDITIENNDVYGDGVNVASRLESIADPGGIYISDAIEKAIRGQSDIQAKYLGESRLKNVDYGVRTYAVQGVGLPIPEIKEDKGLSGHFWAEVQRRGVVRVAISYLVVAMLLILLLNQVQDWGNSLPTWSAAALITLLSVSFPVALFLAWNYERSPDGFVKTTSQQSWQNPYTVGRKKPFTGRFIIMGLVLLIVIMYFYPRFLATPAEDSGVSNEVITTDKSIAVLPFKNDSPDPDNQYFADGMMDEVLNHLQKIAELGVKSRTAVEPYRNSTQTFASIAQELDVAFVLEGAVRKYGDRFRVTTQLIEVESGNHLWSDTYDGIFSDTIFVIQSNIARKIASSLNAVITLDEESSLNKAPTTDVGAYDLYIRGNHERLTYFWSRDEKSLKYARYLFDEALKIDPNYLQAIVGKGETFIAEFKADSAFTYADRAIDLDPNFNKGYGLKGEGYMRLGKSDLAIEFFLKAIDLPPKDEFWFWYHEALGLVYIHQKNDVLKGLPYIKKSLEASIQFRHYPQVAGTYLTIGDYETANEYLQKGLELRPNNFGIIYAYSRMMLVEGKYQEAFQFADSICSKRDRGCFSILFQTSSLLGEFEQAEQYYSQWQSTGSRSFDRSDNYEIGYVYHKQGKIVEGEKIFVEKIQQLESELANEQRNNYGVLPQDQLIDLSRIHAFQGNKKQALKYLAEYAKRGFRYGWHDFILIDPFFESLRDDPEFKAIVEQAQEEKAALRAQVREMEERGELTL
jgi:TolB-like protein/class 3 adenylate cyclase/tetratricopeptide (TPR) repeat protein